VNGAMQEAGRAFRAKDVVYNTTAATAELAMDIAPAYPAAAGITSWVRTVRLNRGRDIVVSDAFSLARPTRDVSLNLMTPCDVAETSPGVLRLACALRPFEDPRIAPILLSSRGTMRARRSSPSSASRSTTLRSPPHGAIISTASSWRLGRRRSGPPGR